MTVHLAVLLAVYDGTSTASRNVSISSNNGITYRMITPQRLLYIYIHIYIYHHVAV
jgi:hypothetical protein